MRRFQYEARAMDGRTLSGEVIAEDSSAAARLIQGAGFFVTAVAQAPPRRRHPSLEPAAIPLEERLFLLEAWAVLLNAGISMQSSLLHLQRGTHHHSVARVLERVQRSVDEGMTLAQALAASRLFPPSWIATLSVAEETGDLIGTLHTLRERALQYQRMKKEMRTSLLGPGFLLGLALVWLWIFVRQVVPALGLFAADLGVTPPVISALTSMADTALEVVRWSIFALGLLLLMTWRSGRSDYELSSLQALIPLELPLVGPWVARFHLISVASALKLQMEAGIPIVDAVHTLAQGIPHRGIRRDLFEAYRKLRSGSAVADSFRHIRFFPPEAHAYLKAGEVSGKIPELLGVLIEETRASLAEYTQRMVTLMRSAVLFLVALLIGLLVLCFWALFALNADVLIQGWRSAEERGKLAL